MGMGDGERGRRLVHGRGDRAREGGTGIQTYALSPYSLTQVCGATVASGALALTSDYQTVLGDGGNAYAYQDTGGSTACIDPTAACLKGSTDVAGTTSATFGTNWGAGIGFNLNQAQGSTTAGAYTVPSNATGITYSLSNLPSQGIRVTIGNTTSSGGTDYCAILKATSGMVPWSSFNTQCWPGGSGTSLSAPPTGPTHVQFQVESDTAVTPFDFCVTGVSFATSGGGGGGSGGSGGTGGAGGSGGAGGAGGTGGGAGSGGSGGSAGAGGSGGSCNWGSSNAGDFTKYYFSQGESKDDVSGTEYWETGCG